MVMDSIASGSGLVQASKLTWKAMGFSGHLVEAMFAPYEAMTAPATNWTKAWLDHYYHYTKADEVRDLAMGPMLEMFKNIQFPMSYFFQAPPTKGEENLNLKFELRMKGALAAIRGVKDLDFLNSTRPLRLPQEPEYVLISGSKDDIVTPNMMNDFEGRLQSQNYHVRSQMLTGGHYVVREKPAEVAVLLETLSN